MGSKFDEDLNRFNRSTFTEPSSSGEESSEGGSDTDDMNLSQGKTKSDPGHDSSGNDATSKAGKKASPPRKKFLFPPVFRRKHKASSLEEEEDESVLTPEEQNEETSFLLEKPMRISMLGLSGSGKTAFLSGVYQEFVINAEHGFSLQLDPAANPKGYYRSIRETAIYDGITLRKDFPGGTINQSIYDMILTCRQKNLFEFDFIDYKGGDLTYIDDPDAEEAARAVKEHLAESDVLFIFVDSLTISNYTDIPDRRHKSGADALSHIYLDLKQKVGRSYHVVLLLSKCDDAFIREEDRKNYYKGLVEKAGAVFQSIRENSLSFLILPVSAVGEGCTRTTQSRDSSGEFHWDCHLVPNKVPVPFNIDLAILYACQKILEMRIQELNDRRRILQREINSLHPGRSYLPGRKHTEAERRKLEEEIRQLLTELDSLMQSIRQVMDSDPRRWVKYILDRESSFD